MLNIITDYLIAGTPLVSVSWRVVVPTRLRQVLSPP
jgi:hypothetical protein